VTVVQMLATRQQIAWMAASLDLVRRAQKGAYHAARSMLRTHPKQILSKSFLVAIRANPHWIGN